MLFELTVEEHGGDRYGEYMSGVRPLYIHLPPELTSWELPNEHGGGVITGAVVPVGNQGYALTKDEYLEMMENGTDATTILSNRRYWAMEPVADIAKALGLRRGQTATILYRLRLELKEHLEKEGITL